MQFVKRLPRVTAALLLAVVVPWAAAPPSNAHPPDDNHTHIEPAPIAHNRPEHGGLGDIGAKLSDPTSDVWALVMNFQGPVFYDGDLNTGSPEVGGNMVFQPVLPFPLYGTGKNAVEDDHAARHSDHLQRARPEGRYPRQLQEYWGHWGHRASLAGQPSRGDSGEVDPRCRTRLRVSQRHEQNSLGSNQYSIGPAVVVGYKTKSFVAVLFPNYFFGVGSSGDRKASTADHEQAESAL